MRKVKILDDAPAGQPLHSHMEPIVDFLLENGNSLAHVYRWGSNREGYFCHVSNPINFEGLEAEFEFPSTIVFGKERNVVFCKKTGCIIQKI